MSRILPVVEGFGDIQAVPALLHRIHQAHPASSALMVEKPWRIHANKIFNNDWSEFEKAASRARALAAHILLLLDTDCEPGRCPRLTAPKINQRLHQFAAGIRTELVLAECEYESWFLAAIASLGGQCGIPLNLVAPAHSIHGAKEWLTNQMPAGQPYRETIHQLELTRQFDLTQAATVPSFAKFQRAVISLLG